MKNLGDKLKAHLKKDGVLATLLYSFKYLYFKFQLLVLFFNLKKRLAKRNYEIKHGLTIAEVRKKTLQFTESLRLPNGPYGRYRYAPGQDGPVLYASLYAALTLHLYNDLADLSTIKRQEWIDYIKSFQSADGWFRDPAIACELAETADWWGWRHLTLHAVMAYRAWARSLNGLQTSRASSAGHLIQTTMHPRLALANQLDTCWHEAWRPWPS